MILEDVTYKAYGYYPSARKPQSNKPIMAACNDCGKVRTTLKYQYRPLCGSCAKKGKTHTEETKVNMSAAQKGKNGNNWQGGKSFKPYCEKFDEAYKQLIRNKYENRCFWCNMTTEENGRKLDVHHVNYNKNCGCDETKCICVPLCMRCHGSSGSDRVGWQEKITKKLELSGVLLED
jgi:hypothetical protein